MVNQVRKSQKWPSIWHTRDPPPLKKFTRQDTAKRILQDPKSSDAQKEWAKKQLKK
jgi:hypothetical protein